MSLSNERISYLLQKHTDQEATKAEEQELFLWVNENRNHQPIEEHIKKLIDHYDNNEKVSGVDWERLYLKILENRREIKPLIFQMRWTIIAAAGVIILMLGAGSYFIFFNKAAFIKGYVAAHKKGIKNDVAPGGNRAILTLANGSQIILDSVANGTVTQQGNTKIIKLASGQLAYNVLNEKPGEILYNTISTPKGGQFQIVLADGTRVWLNATSSLKYPISFSGKERDVKLTGEGYFEVAHDATKPFKVSVNGMDIQVLGTHFNINAYSDEASIKTTLLEGSVKVILGHSVGHKIHILKPGEQAILDNAQDNNSNSSSFRVTSDINVENEVAWKDGYFVFDNTDLHTLMRQVARWYDIDVNYEGSVTEDGFTGKISRNEPLSKFLKVLELNDVYIRTEGRKITIMPLKN